MSVYERVKPKRVKTSPAIFTAILVFYKRRCHEKLLVLLWLKTTGITNLYSILMKIIYQLLIYIDANIF